MAFATGIGWGRLDPSLLVATATVFVGLAGLLFLRPDRRVRNRPLILARAAALVLLWTGAGALTERIHHRHFRSSTLLALAEVPLGRDRPEPVLLRGRVIDDPVRARDRSHFLFAVQEVRRDGRWEPGSGRIRVSLRDPSARARIVYGDRLEIPVRLRPPRNFGNPGLSITGVTWRGRGSTYSVRSRMPASSSIFQGGRDPLPLPCTG